MADNGDKLNHEKPKENRLVFKVEITPNSEFVYQLNSRYIPALTYGLKLIEIEIDKLVIDTKIKSMQKSGIIEKPNYMGNLRGFLKRGHRR